MSALPEFTAVEVNELSNRARKNEYYKKVHEFILDYLDGHVKVTESTTKWLWGIKKDLEEER
jgi:hypothetical protein